MNPTTLFLLLLLLLIAAPLAQSQSPKSQLPAPSPASAACNGIFLSYTYTSGSRIPPILTSNPTKQPYRFESTLTIINNSPDELKSWRVFVGFKHDEFLVSASNAVLADGNSLPGRVGNGTVFAGFPGTDLKTAIETAGEITQMSAQIDLVGTQFGIAPPRVPMPDNITLANDGFICPRATMEGRREMLVCCTPDLNAVNNTIIAEEFLPRKDGDLTIMYDVLRTYDSNYWAEVTISNHNPLGRLDNWNLSFDWMRDEFIMAMRGAYPFVRDSSECIFGRQGQVYQQLDFSTVLNCERRPTLIDLPLEMTNNSDLGNLPFCCRNGTILPPTMDPSKSTSKFQMNVFKMPPDVNRSKLTVPQNWKIEGRLNSDYTCGPPVRVSPSEFPGPFGLPTETTAVASWQVVCNITHAKSSSPRCCVSFSAYYNESIIPCPTCACGCPRNAGGTCSTMSPALFLPSLALLVPFENRTTLSTAWAALKHRSVPNPLPCGDNCGVSLNWHVLTDFKGGWSARLTLFNWEDSSFADWFVAVELDKAGVDFERVYSFNGSTIPNNGVNNTVFMQGLPGLNYLVGETDGANPEKDPRVPGKQQSVLSFKKKNTPNIDIVGGAGFPTRVLFNGEECALPKIIPTNGCLSFSSGAVFFAVLAVVVLMLLQQ